MESKVRKTVLVVDDEEFARDVAVIALEQHYNVVTAMSVDEMKKKLGECVPDIILLDLYLPNVTGLDIIEILSQNTVWSKIPVIFVTSEQDMEIENEALSSGAFDYIRKPYSAAVLQTRVARILKMVKPTGVLMQEKLQARKKKEDEKKVMMVEAYLREVTASGPIFIKARDLGSELNISSQITARCLAKIAERGEFTVGKWGNTHVWKIARK